MRRNEAVTKAISVDPETMHGLPVFRGTRVPVQTLFEVRRRAPPAFVPRPRLSDGAAAQPTD
ncbi:MAG: DUF433 domain-containing protein [Acidobacteriia bacterium]|nr:DUF433 domain-containing protein [Terriglobia bacterium]